MRKSEAIMYAEGILNGSESSATAIIKQVLELHGQDGVDEVLSEISRVRAGVAI
jgi:hypothetical protein